MKYRMITALFVSAALAVSAAPEDELPLERAPVQTASAQNDLLEQAPFQPAQATPFELPDQFKDMHTLAFPQEKPVLLGVADRHGAEEVLKWYKPLNKAYGDQVRYVAVGALHTLPRFLAPVIRHFLRKDVDKPIYLDWEGDVVEGYKYEEKTSNLFVIDQEGNIVLRINGPRTEEGLAQVKEVLDRLLEQSAVQNQDSLTP